VVIGVNNPSVVVLSAALAGFFAALTSTAIFKTQEKKAQILSHLRRMLGPLVHHSKVLLESCDVDAQEFRTRLSRFEQLEDSEDFGFLSDELQGTYIDCVEEGRKYGKILSGELTVTVIPNDFGITSESIDRGTMFAPVGRLLRMLIEGCRHEAKVPAPLRTLRIGREGTKKIGRFVLYKTFEETSAD